jgi:hypothetical protein
LTRKNIIARTVSSNNKIVSSRFFEQSQFEQMIKSLHKIENPGGGGGVAKVHAFWTKYQWGKLFYVLLPFQ